MKKEIINFFDERQLGIHKIIEKHPELSPESIEEACEKFYQMWEDGYRCKPIMIVKGHIIPLAKQCSGKKYLDEKRDIKTAVQDEKKRGKRIMVYGVIGSAIWSGLTFILGWLI